MDILVSSGKNSEKILEKTISLPASVNQDVNLKVYRNGTVVDSVRVNPSLAGSYRLAFTGTSGVDTVIITLDDQNYMELSFNFDTGEEPTVVNQHDYIPSGTGGGDGDGGDDSSGEEEGQ